MHMFVTAMTEPQASLTCGWHVLEYAQVVPMVGQDAVHHGAAPIAAPLCWPGLAALPEARTAGHPPDFIWGGAGGGMSTSTISCIPNGYWAQQQRHKQYIAGHQESWGGVPMNIDNDCSNARAYGSLPNSDGTCV